MKVGVSFLPNLLDTKAGKGKGAALFGAHPAPESSPPNCSPKTLPFFAGTVLAHPLWPSHPSLHFSVVELTVPCSLTGSPTRPFSGTNSEGILNGFNKTVLRTLPRSRNLIVVESVLMAVAFLAMLLVRPGTGVGRCQ